MKTPARARLLALLALSILVLAGCGSARHPSDATAENNGYYVKAGPITYQLQISRELNQFATEDHQYLNGLPASTPSPKPDQIWYGVFLWAQNEGKHAASTAGNFDIKDTSGITYYPVPLNSSINGYAWTSQMLEPLGIEPAPDTTASFGPTQGGLVLFKLSTSAYANRPLTLEIHAPGVSTTSTISLYL